MQRWLMPWYWIISGGMDRLRLHWHPVHWPAVFASGAEDAGRWRDSVGGKDSGWR